MSHLKLSRAALAGAFIAIGAARLCASSVDVVFYDNRFGTVDDATGAYTQIGTLPISAAGGIAEINNLLYLEDFGNNLFTVDSHTGAARLVGSTGLGLAMGAFAGGPAGLFEIDGASDLYSIDPITGKGAKIGSTGLAANNGTLDTSLSLQGSSLYYTAGRSGQADELYLLNTVTGVASDLGSTGTTGIAGSALVSGRLELYQYGQSVNYVYSAAIGSNEFTRGAILQAQIIDGGVANGEPGGAATVSTNTPEPAALLLLATGICMMIFLGRRSGTKPRIHG